MPAGSFLFLEARLRRRANGAEDASAGQRPEWRDPRNNVRPFRAEGPGAPSGRQTTF
jgi:hypothetical protein